MENNQLHEDELPAQWLEMIGHEAVEATKEKAKDRIWAFQRGYEDGYFMGASSYAIWKIKYDTLQQEHDRLKEQLREAQGDLQTPEFDSKWLSGGCRERFSDLNDKQHDWRSFYNGWIEGRADAINPILQRKQQQGAVWVNGVKTFPIKKRIVAKFKHYDDPQLDWVAGYASSSTGELITFDWNVSSITLPITHERWDMLYWLDDTGNHYQELKEAYDEERKQRVHLEKENDLITGNYQEMKEKAERMEKSFTDLKKYCDNAKEWVFDKEGKAIISVVSNMIDKALNGAKEVNG